LDFIFFGRGALDYRRVHLLDLFILFRGIENLNESKDWDLIIQIKVIESVIL